MGKPVKYDPESAGSNPLQNAICEIISGLSSLNMEPDPIPEDKLTENDRYISQRDRWVKHSVPHFREAIQSIRFAIADKEKLEHMLWKANDNYLTLAEAKKALLSIKDIIISIDNKGEDK